MTDPHHPRHTASIDQDEPNAPVKAEEWLVAIDLDGTTIDETGHATTAVKSELRRVTRDGHHLIVATGRSAATTLSVLDDIEIWPEHVICSNGGMVLKRDATKPRGYRRLRASTFDAIPVVETIRQHIPTAHFAVENEQGAYRYTHPFPPLTTEPAPAQTVVTHDTLIVGNAIRVVAIVPDGDVQEFRQRVAQMTLTGVSYSLGWTAWLDVAAEGVTKAAAIEKIRASLGFNRNRVMAVGDGYNDIEMLTWAALNGRGVAMGHAPAPLIAVASEVTGTLSEDGLAHALSTL